MENYEKTSKHFLLLKKNGRRSGTASNSSSSSNNSSGSDSDDVRFSLFPIVPLPLRFGISWETTMCTRFAAAITERINAVPSEKLLKLASNAKRELTSFSLIFSFPSCKYSYANNLYACLFEFSSRRDSFGYITII